MWRVTNDQGNHVALVARTLPAASDVVGYRGPSEASIVFSPDLNVVSVSLLDSADTEEHVNAVLEDTAFFGHPDQQKTMLLWKTRSSSDSFRDGHGAAPPERLKSMPFQEPHSHRLPWLKEF